MNDFLSYINRLSPTKCRLLALNDRTPMSTNDLAKRSGLHPTTIKALARAESWEKFQVETIVKFTRACGVDLLHQKRPLEKLKRMFTAVHGPPHARTKNHRYWLSVFTGEKSWRQKAK